jgi:hypothetical protein
MSEDFDRVLTEKLRARAPAQRDPLFRVGVLERREKSHFRRKSIVTLAAATAVAVIALTAVAQRPALLAPATVLGVLALAALGAFRYRGAVARVFRRFSP